MEIVELALYIALLTFMIGSMVLHHEQSARLVRESQEETKALLRALTHIVAVCITMQNDVERMAVKMCGEEPDGTCVKKSWTVIRQTETETEAADDVEEGEAPEAEMQESNEN